ncbi:MAG: DUF1232 domain-containing protein [Ignavibacteriae bacterium]|nr:DUF1232 domain-containing protein [Ignavibacteriota bacterium]
MDKELDEMFADYELGAEVDEEHYLKQSKEVHEKFERKMRDVGSRVRFAGDLIALWRYFTDTDVPWQRKVVVVFALLYFISPIDTIPDLAPFVGYLDDFGVILAVTKFMSDQLAPYYPA